VVSLLLDTAKDVRGCISTAAECDTGLPQSDQQETGLLNLID